MPCTVAWTRCRASSMGRRCSRGSLENKSCRRSTSTLSASTTSQTTKLSRPPLTPHSPRKRGNGQGRMPWTSQRALSAAYRTWRACFAQMALRGPRGGVPQSRRPRRTKVRSSGRSIVLGRFLPLNSASSEPRRAWLAGRYREEMNAAIMIGPSVAKCNMQHSKQHDVLMDLTSRAAVAAKRSMLVCRYSGM